MRHRVYIRNRQSIHRSVGPFCETFFMPQTDYLHENHQSKLDCIFTGGCDLFLVRQFNKRRAIDLFDEDDHENNYKSMNLSDHSKSISTRAEDFPEKNQICPKLPFIVNTPRNVIMNDETNHM